MARIASLALAFAVGHAIALPTDPIQIIDKRQSSGSSGSSGLSSLLGGLMKGGSSGSGSGGLLGNTPFSVSPT